jgi:hypothetical protein
MHSYTEHSAPLKVFITHGRYIEAKDEFIKWLKHRRGLPVEPLDFAGAAILGDAIYETFEREACEADAAIILATPDDIGRVVDGVDDSLRARQNVWMELGWFWGRLGRRRTLLLIKGDIEIPSNWHGINYLNYRDSIYEKSAELKSYLKSLRSLKPDLLTEVIYLSSDPLTRDREWAEIHQAARKKLIITGVAMGKMRHVLPLIFQSMKEEKPDLLLEIVVVHPKYTLEHYELFEKHHGENTVRDNHSFFEDLLKHLKRFVGVSERVTVTLYKGFPSFAAVVADGSDWGSTMIAQTFVPNARNNSFSYPRFKLKHRSDTGVYLTYWNGVKDIIEMSHEKIIGVNEIENLVNEINLNRASASLNG